MDARERCLQVATRMAVFTVMPLFVLLLVVLIAIMTVTHRLFNIPE